MLKWYPKHRTGLRIHGTDGILIALISLSIFTPLLMQKLGRVDISFIPNYFYIISILLYLLCLGYSIIWKRKLLFVLASVIFTVSFVYAYRSVDSISLFFSLNKDVFIKKASSMDRISFSFVVFPMNTGPDAPFEYPLEYIIYDVHDGFLLEDKDRRTYWKAKHDRYVVPLADDCRIHWRRLEGHFYYVSEECN